MAASPYVLNAPRWMSNNEAWREAYNLDPYLAGASIETLTQRSRDIGDNLMWVSEDGKLTVRSETGEDQRWWALWTHILEEIGRRGLPWYEQDLFNNDRLRAMITAPNAPPGLRILRGSRLPQTPYLARLGQRDHVLDAYARGRFRITPASLYGDPSLNAAIQDDELSVAAIRHTAGRGIGAAQLRNFEKPIAEVVRKARLVGDYYVLCFSKGYDIRLVEDFKADALLIIRKPEVFARRLQAAVAKAKPHFDPRSASVTYYDPYRLEPDPGLIPMLKHFRHAYQSEHRFAWLGEEPSGGFEPFFVELGPLRDISTLYCLDRLPVLKR